MTRIKIKDLPKDMRIGPEEMKKVRGGAVIKPIFIQGVDGESTDDKHKDWIDILADSGKMP
jgi:hypothetical protein